MADGTVTLNIGTGGDVLDTENVAFSTAPTTRVRERLQVSGALAAEIARVRSDAPASADYGLVARVVGLPSQTGVWGYTSGSLTSAGSLTCTGRCIGIRVFANAADGSFTVNSGNVITVRSGSGVDIDPRGQVTAPVVTWVSGSLDVLLVALT